MTALHLTGTQIRMARAALRWSLHDLAGAADVSRATCQRMEMDDDEPSAHKASIHAVQSALELAGCMFKDSGWNVGPMVRAPAPALRRQQQDQNKKK